MNEELKRLFAEFQDEVIEFFDDLTARRKAEEQMYLEELNKEIYEEEMRELEWQAQQNKGEYHSSNYFSTYNTENFTHNEMMEHAIAFKENNSRY